MDGVMVVRGVVGLDVVRPLPPLVLAVDVDDDPLERSSAVQI